MSVILIALGLLASAFTLAVTSGVAALSYFGESTVRVSACTPISSYTPLYNFATEPEQIPLYNFPAEKPQRPLFNFWRG